MNMEQIFAKSIRRPIEGVIKADDESQLENELNEYVLTSEAADRLTGFFEDYNQNRSNGAWLSGFFGSGKSHLLKMLAVVLENRVVNGHAALDLFLPKCADNPMLKGLLARACQSPSRSILFNIDQKADVINKTETDAVLSVFLKVFNESCGYFAQKPHIAQFERELDEEGLLGSFKEAFASLSGKGWDDYGRKRETRVSDAIDQAYAQVTGTTKANVIESYRANFKLSIEDFAQLVKDYIDAQDKTHPGFRLNFFVDEVGQFVANNTKLMLNLQTLGETLNTQCKNRAWLIVTSQMDLSNVVGGMNREQGNDFTRIEARFKTKIPLTGANADEVIRRRLLDKTAEAIPSLASLYGHYAADVKTLFDFTDGSKRYAVYADEAQFVATYPFVPYQFDLFQTTMLNLSTHDAFTGRYTAIAERSMLAVCQDAAKKLCDSNETELGALVPFDYWFDGIRLSLKSVQINQILVGEKNLGDPFAVRILKALFLVKYVREFNATARNLTILLRTRLDENGAELQKRIEETLARLENESYVQRVGDKFEYLTDEEKDLDKEIKSLDIAPAKFEEAYADILFKSILPQRKITCANHADYAFSPQIDDHPVGRVDAQLALNVITPNHPNATNLLMMKSAKFGSRELTVVLPPSAKILQDVITFKKTQQFLSQNPPISQEGSRRTLLESRAEANRQLGVKIENGIRELIVEAKILVGGEEAEVRSNEAKTRLSEGFEKLVARVYYNRRMVEGLERLGESDLPRILAKDPELGLDVAESEGERELMTVLRQNQALGQRTTMRTLTETFEGIPYGWRLSVIECLTARLWATGKIALVQNGRELDKSNVKAALVNTRNHESLVISVQRAVSPQEIRALKDFAQDYFSEPVAAADAKGVGTAVKQRFLALVDDVQRLVAAYRYPFVETLNEQLASLRLVAAKPEEWYFSPEFAQAREDRLAEKEDVIDPIVKLLKGPQIAIFESAVRLLNEQRNNLGYLAGDDGVRLTELVESRTVYRNGGILQVKALVESLRGKLQSLVEEARQEAKKTLAGLQRDIESHPLFAEATGECRERVARSFAEIAAQIDTQLLVAMIRDAVQRFQTVTYPDLLSSLDSEPTPGRTKPGGSYVQIQMIRPETSVRTLEKESDVEQYVDALRAVLKAELQKGNKVLV